MKRIFIFFTFSILFLGLHPINFSNELRRTDQRIKFLVDIHSQLTAEKENFKDQALSDLRGSLQHSFNGSRRNAMFRTVGAVSAFIACIVPSMRFGLMYADSEKIEQEISICRSYDAMLRSLKKVSKLNL